MNKFLLIACFTTILILSSGCVTEKVATYKNPPPPPPPKPEFLTPQANPRAIWVKGYWAWKGSRRGYVWVPGHWEKR
jgi:hypothetical protein